MVNYPVDFDVAVRRQAWEGQIAVMFQLSSNEVLAREEPPPLFILCPRQSFLPCFGSKIRDHFSPFTTTLEDGLWFEFNGMPLPWQYSIGVLFDVFGENEISWQLTVHFQSYPDTQILRHSSDNLVSNYLQSLKQATCMWFGSVQCVKNLSKDDTTRMWDAAKQNSYASFEQVYNTLLSKEERSIPLIFPIRIWLRGFDPALENRPIQPNFRTQDKDEDEVRLMTVLDLLKDATPGRSYEFI